MSAREPQSEVDKASLEGLALAVQHLRRERGLSIQQVAERGGLSVSEVTGLEEVAAGREEPRWGTLRRAAQGLGIDLDDLIALSYELAPGPAGDRLREQELEQDEN